MRVCSHHGCPTLIETSGRCPAHKRERQRELGTTTQRGYGSKHQKLRAEWKPKVEAGQVTCARCRLPILVGQLWHLDHDDNDRSKYIGPAHKFCNLSAAGKAAHQ